jgi:adenosylmethionine-8-amino-7-oxononanoate aminotransferase
MTLSNRDKTMIWHPFTQEKTAVLPLSIKRAEGSYLYDENDASYLDLISSWWVNLHGHSHPFIAKAIYEQALKLEHVIFAGFTHEPAVELCTLLKSALPSSLTRFFFSDNGSTSVEVALKMAYQYWFNQGQKQRQLFLSFEGGYHGDTFGAMAVGARSGFHDPFQSFFFQVVQLPFPATWEEDEKVFEKEKETLKFLEQQLEEKGHQIAAFILEPLVQGAAGMRYCRPEFIKSLVEKVRAYDILVIYDEVMTGFGRTGTTFALDQLESLPDFLCLSKGITGGFLPLALTITTEKIYNAFLHEKWNYAFAHGHSYTANPIACAAAIASFHLLFQPTTQDAMRNLYKTHQHGIQYLKEKKQILRPRVVGTIAAFEEVENSYDTSRLKNRFLAEGLVLRPLKNTVYLLPPYSTTPKEIENSYEKISFLLNKK